MITIQLIQNKVIVCDLNKIFDSNQETVVVCTEKLFHLNDMKLYR